MKIDTKQRLQELLFLFLKLGFTAFGGPAAHIAMMENEVVGKRNWLTKQEFLDLVSFTNLIPGPNSTELAIHIGKIRAGWLGLLVAGISFILPATIIVTAIAWAYVKYGTLPETRYFLLGVKPVIIAILFQALSGLARTAIKDKAQLVVVALAVVAGLLNYNEIFILVTCGILSAFIKRGPFSSNQSYEASTGILGLFSVPLLISSHSVLAGPSLKLLFFTFCKIGSVLFGSGYVLLAFLRSHFVQQYSFLTESQLLDAIAVGQFTPGPVFTTATFIGYLILGLPGAMVSTAGIFLPAFIFVAMSAFLIPKIRKSQLAGNILDGVNAASLALMLTVTIHLLESSIIDLRSVAILVTSLILLLRFKVNSAWLILGGSLVGLLLE